MSSQKTDREEVYIEQSSQEDQNTKGAFNSIFNLVNRKCNDLAESELGSTKLGFPSVGSNLFNKQEPFMGLLNEELARNNPDIPKEQTKLQRDMHKSREIHRQLQNKKHRWRPSELELTVLKLHFEKNKYPTKEEKETLLKNLELNFNSTIDMSQLNRWFQHEREKEAKHGYTSMSKNTYKKFKQDDLEFLKERFSENTYPKTEEMMEMAKTLTVNLSKIENWYKHNRRSLAKKGIFTLKTKKYFKKDEVGYLLKMFELYPRPTKEQILEMGQHLNCNELQIKNWYSNKRKKLKLVAKRQGVESQETQLHQAEIPIFPQQNTQINDLFNNSQINIPQVLPMGAVLQANESNPMMQNFVAPRALTPLQAPQVHNPYTNSVLSGAPLMSYPMNSFVGAPINAGALPSGVVPIFIIPSAPGTLPTSMPLGQNTIPLGQSTLINGQMPVQEMDIKNFAQPQQMLFNNNGAIKTVSTPGNLSGLQFGNTIPQQMMQPFMNQTANPALNFLKQANGNPNGLEISGTNWLGQNQPTVAAMQQGNPIIIVNKQPSMQSQPMSFNIQTQPTNFIQANLNPTAYGGGAMMPGFNTVGTNMTGFPSYEAPMQIQYLTSLYCPYSNNNIFSNYYPVVQNGQNFTVPTPEKTTIGADVGMMNGINVNPQQVVNNGMSAFNQGVQRPLEVPRDPRLFSTRNDNDVNRM